MNAYQRNGMIIVGLISCWTAYTNWEGNIARSLATILGGMMFGFLIGHIIQKNGG